MLSWSLTFLTVAVLGGLVGFSGLSGPGTNVARIISFCFIVLFVLSLAMARKRAR